MPLPFLLGCQPENHSLARVEQPITGGTVSTSADNAVVLVANGKGWCAGALVAQNLVLTARGCVLAFGSVGELCEADGTVVAATERPMQDVEADQLLIYGGSPTLAESSARGLEIVSTESPTTCRNNIALVVLDRSLTEWPILPLRLTRPTSIGETMTLIGYGMTSDPKADAGQVGDAGASVEQVGDAGASVELAGDAGASVERSDASVAILRQRRGGVPVLAVGANRFGSGSGVAAPGTLLLGPGMCGGDSGGPAVSDASGAIVGVASLPSSDVCDGVAEGVYTQVANNYDTVLKAFARAGAEPWIEGEATVMRSELPRDSGCAFVASRASSSEHLRAGLISVIGVALARRRRETTLQN